VDFEVLGPFHLYPPVPGTIKTDWSMSWCEEWLPLTLESREACLLVMGAFMASGGAAADRLYERYQQEDPSVARLPLTVDQVLDVFSKALWGASEPCAEDAGDEEECDHPNGFGPNGCPCGAFAPPLEGW
jgi:hypothetical protein